MTRALILPSAAIPIQRNRRLLLSLSACAVPVHSACGGGADLSYDTEQALYVVGEAIMPNKPLLTGSNTDAAGNSAPRFSVVPALPAGLTLHPQTGVISGTPTQLSRQVSYTIAVRNNRGFAETCARITVTSRGAWSSVASVPDARQAANISPLPDGRLLLSGGGDGAGGPLNSAAVFEPSSSTWHVATQLQSARQSHLAVVLRDGRVLVLGGDAKQPGTGANNPGYGSTEVYDALTHTWSLSGSLKVPRDFATAHLLPDGKVLVVGGFNAHTSQRLDSAELYNPVTGAWTLLSTPLSTPRLHHAAALLPDGKTLLVAGGTTVTTAELYKVDGTATQVIPYGVYGYRHEAVRLDDGSVLVLCSDSKVSKRFNPLNSTWTTSSMVTGERFFPTVTVLADGRVLVPGVRIRTRPRSTTRMSMSGLPLPRWLLRVRWLPPRCRAMAVCWLSAAVAAMGSSTRANATCLERRCGQAALMPCIGRGPV